MKAIGAMAALALAACSSAQAGSVPAAGQGVPPSDGGPSTVSAGDAGVGAGAAADGPADGAADSAAADPGESQCSAAVGAGLAAAPVPFALPAARCNTRFDVVAGESSSLSWTMAPLDEGQHPALVVTRDACDAVVGSARWDLYPWSASGFATAPRPFTIPPPRCGEHFDAMAGDSAVAWATIDLTGDDKPDLVVTRDACDAQVGSARWDVHSWHDDGVSPAPAPFALPSPRCGTSFATMSGDGSDVAWALADLTGDRHPDLVVTRDRCHAAVGQSHWDVYPWSAAGFAATPTSFALPAPRCSVSFASMADEASSLSWLTTDLTGDGNADLVVASDACDDAVGRARWDVYGWTAAGFSAAPSAFGVPASRCGVTFSSAAGASDKLEWATTRLAGGTTPDLLVTFDSCDADVGKTRWDRYAWSATGFAAAPTGVALPAPRCQTSFSSLAESAGPLVWSSLALGDACRVGLVVTRDDCDNVVGSSRWDFYPQAP